MKFVQIRDKIRKAIFLFEPFNLTHGGGVINVCMLPCALAAYIASSNLVVDNEHASYIELSHECRSPFGVTCCYITLY